MIRIANVESNCILLICNSDHPFDCQARITALFYAYRMHEIRCHELSIAIFNRLPFSKKVSIRFNLSLNEKMKFWRLHSRHHLGKTNHGKGDILGAEK